MANIRIDLEATVVNGQALTFKSPADCSQVTGLIIYYPVGDTTTSKTFQFADAHGNNVGSVSLFAEDVLVKVILDTDAGKAYVQNADTNAYLEGQLAGKAPASHKHTKSEITDFPTSMTPTAHNQAASTITAGTFAGQVVANASAQTPGTALLRNSKIVSADTTPTNNGEICWTYK
jgi:hypothetical protein